MKKKIPFDDQEMEDIQYVYLEEFNRESWLRLGKKFCNIITKEDWEDFESQVSQLEYSFKKISKSPSLNSGPVSFWKTLQNAYPKLFKLAIAILALPHSSVPVERIFSNMKDILSPQKKSNDFRES